MWFYKLILLGLIWLKTPKASPGMIAGTTNKVVGDKLTNDGLWEMYKPVFTEVQERLGKETYMQGLFLVLNNNQTNLLLADGKMTYDGVVNMHVSVPREDDEDKDHFKVMFHIPEITIFFTFRYDDLRVIMKVHREGDITLKQEGPIVIKFTLLLPKSKSNVDELISQKQCVGVLKRFETNLDENRLTLMQLNYESWARKFGLSMTGNHVKKLIAGLEEDLILNMEMTLQSLVEPPFVASPSSFNCYGEEYNKLKVEDPGKLVDPDIFRKAEHYLPQK